MTKKQTSKSRGPPQAEARGNYMKFIQNFVLEPASLDLRMRQHLQFLTLAFFVNVSVRMNE